MEKSGTVPAQSLLNTFVSTTHGDKQDRQASWEGMRRGVARNTTPPPLFRLNVSLLIKEEKKRWLP